MTIGIPFFREAKTYKCPICGKEHALDDCIIVKEKINRKFLNRTYDSQLSTYRTKVFKDIYLVSYYNIRICPKCAKKKTHTIRHHTCTIHHCFSSFDD